MLSGYYMCLSYDLLLLPSAADRQTDTHTHTPMFADEMIFFLHTPGLKIYILQDCVPGLDKQMNMINMFIHIWN